MGTWLVGAFEGEVRRVEDGIFVVLDAEEEAVQDGRDGQRDDGHEHNGQAEPESEGVPLPSPELAGEGDGAGAGGVDQRAGREGHGRGAEDEVAEAEEGNDQQEFEGIDDVIGQLRGGDVEAQQERCREAEDGRAAEDGIDADQQADGDAPGELSWGSAHAEQREDGKSDAAIEPVVVERRRAGLDAGWVHVARSH